MCLFVCFLFIVSDLVCNIIGGRSGVGVPVARPVLDVSNPLFRPDGPANKGRTRGESHMYTGLMFMLMFIVMFMLMFMFLFMFYVYVYIYIYHIPYIIYYIIYTIYIYIYIYY